MKRDLDLVRHMLLTVEKAEGTVDDTRLCSYRYGIREVVLHVELMRERGLITAKVDYGAGHDEPLAVEVYGLTWEGHDYLDTIRSEKVWRKAKAVIASAVGETSLSVVKQTCAMVATELIKAQICA